MGHKGTVSKRVLTIDIGNTSTSLGIYRKGRISKVGRLEGPVKSQRQVRDRIQPYLEQGLDGLCLASVVPSATRLWKAVLQRVECPVEMVTHRSELGLKINYPKPASIGPDRLANAVGAASKFGAPVIVADFGTALTFDIVSAQRAYEGGVIAPGLPLMFSYLAEKTALLPHIEVKPVRRKIGKSTEEAMRVGAKYGYRGMVREIYEALCDQLGQVDVPLCATGGYSNWVLNGLDLAIQRDPHLTLFGLGEIFLLNHGG